MQRSTETFQLVTSQYYTRIKETEQVYNLSFALSFEEVGSDSLTDKNLLDDKSTMI